MTDPVTIDTPHGPVTMPWPQAEGIAYCIERFAAQGKESTWHPNECGCCYSVHELTHHPVDGYVISQDGGIDWIDVDGGAHPVPGKSGSKEVPAE